MRARNKPLIATVDSETDPFKYGRTPEPFVIGFYVEGVFKEFWGDDCVKQFVEYISTIDEPMMIYAHNGGRFDFMFMLQYISRDVFIIGSRLVKGYIGIHQIRDSYAILPIALKQYNKDEIDYALMERDKRERHRKEIVSYLKSDCVYLHELVVAFHEEFGDKLTVGSASMTELRKIIPFDKLKQHDDGVIRQWYFGGRNQCFRGGVIKGCYKVYDINSSYPDVMRRCRHPIGDRYSIGHHINKKTMFAKVRGRNLGRIGAFPVKTKLGLDFTQEYGDFYVSIHELEVAEETGLFHIEKVMMTLDFEQVDTFAAFIDHFYDKRLIAKASKDKIHDLFYKLIMNSSYGKTGQNPEDFCEHALTNGELMPIEEGWELIMELSPIMFWSRPNPQIGGYYHVGIAASITGAARASLLRGLAHTDDPLYCDTDSIIGKSVSSIKIDETELGAWKCEAEADTVAIAGKKLYAAWLDGECVKSASKGARLEPKDILAIAKGGSVKYDHDAPKFNMMGQAAFISRRIKMTLDPSVEKDYDIL